MVARLCDKYHNIVLARLQFAHTNVSVQCFSTINNLSVIKGRGSWVELVQS